MNAPLLARDIMVTQLVTLSPEMDVYDAIGLLLRHRISGAPVLDDDRTYLGVFSEKCCMGVLVEAAYDGLPSTRVGEFMQCDSIAIDEETDLLTIAQIFQRSGNRRLAVLRDGKLVGQISRRDVLRATHELLAPRPNREAALLYLSGIISREEAPIA
ncbi:MAG: CBS domain-containing protein [Planctomycetaceae bacterium]